MSVLSVSGRKPASAATSSDRNERWLPPRAASKTTPRACASAIRGSSWSATRIPCLRPVRAWVTTSPGRRRATISASGSSVSPMWTMTGKPVASAAARSPSSTRVTPPPAAYVESRALNPMMKSGCAWAAAIAAGTSSQPARDELAEARVDDPDRREVEPGQDPRPGTGRDRDERPDRGGTGRPTIDDRGRATVQAVHVGVDAVAEAVEHVRVQVHETGHDQGVAGDVDRPRRRRPLPPLRWRQGLPGPRPPRPGSRARPHRRPGRGGPARAGRRALCGRAGIRTGSRETSPSMTIDWPVI